MKQRIAIGLALAAVAAGVVAGIADSWKPEAWTALAAWVTAGIAGAAGIVALSQLAETRRARREQTQPYVVASIEPSPAASWIGELVVRNFGTTAAHDVRLNIEPPPTRAIDEGKEDEPAEYVWLPERIPVLVPGQEWRTVWDSGIKRVETDLPDHHDAEISYADSQGRSYTSAAVLDWRMLKDRDVVTVYGEHHAAEALREIKSAIGKWNETGARGLRVYVRDGDAKAERDREQWEALKAAEQAREDADEPS